MVKFSKLALGVLIGGSVVFALGFLAFFLRLPAVAIEVVALILLGIVCMFFRNRELQQIAARQAKIWQDRPSLSPDEFGSRYFEPALAPTAARLFHLLQESSDQDFSRLDSSDDSRLSRGGDFQSGRTRFLFPESR